MEEKTKKELEKEKAEKRAIERENKLLRILLPTVGLIAFIIGLLAFILTLDQGQTAITVFFAIMFSVGFIGILYGIVVLIRIKKPNFLKKKVAETEDEVLSD